MKQEYEECVYNLLQEEPSKPKPIKYTSKFSPNIFPTGSTLGLKNSSINVINLYGNYEKPYLNHSNIGNKSTIGPPDRYYLASPRDWVKKGTGKLAMAKRYQIPPGKKISTTTADIKAP